MILDFSQLSYIVQTAPAALVYTGVMVFGLVVGSFVNVLIYRMPKIMLHEYGIEELPHKLSLSFPASHCTTCQKPIAWYDNIPIISWIVLLGKCRNCEQLISARYPLIELSCGLFGVICYAWFGFSLQFICALVFVWSLLVLALIDFDTQLLPDRIVMPLTGIGLLASTQNIFCTANMSIYGLVIGFLSLYSVTYIFALFTGKQGMGFGDFKLLGAVGAWLGASMLPLVILLAAVLGSLYGIFQFKQHKGVSQAFAFGPFLAFSAVIALLYGDSIMYWYISYILGL